MLRLFTVTLLTLLGIGPASVAPAGEPEDRGKALLARLCAGCHAVGRSGNSPHRGAPSFRTLGERYDIAELADRMTDRLVSTHPDMPDFQFSEEDAKAIRSYLYSIQR
jgi:mono/diheme cytochrome c family protein